MYFMNRILLISNNSLRRTNSNGSTLINHLSAFKSDEVITFSIDNALPDKDTGIAHFKTTDNEHLKYFLSKKKLGRVVLNDELSESRSLPKGEGKHKGIKESALGHLIREFIWKHNHKERDNLYKFIDEYKPNVILYMCGRSSFMNNITLDISKKYHIPVVIYTSEDEYFHTYPFYKVIKNILQRRLKKSYKELLKVTSEVICQHDKLNKLFSDEFNVKCVTIMPSITLDELKVRDNNDGDIVYIGNIQPNRYSTLIYIAATLYKIDSSLSIHLYSGDLTTRLRHILSRYTNIKIHNPVSKDKVKDIINNARLLLHFESFKKKDRVLFQNGFSTKIPESLASGVPFLVVAPSYAGFSTYMIDNNLCYISNLDNLKDNLEKVLTDTSYRNELSLRQIEVAKKNHDISINSKRIKEELTNI